MTTVIGKGGHRIIRWAALLIALTVTAASILQTANIKPTLAATGGYPWYNAPCAWNGSTTGPCTDYDWGESTCPSGDGYCNPSNQINGYYLYDQWGVGFRNCTSYAAWMLSTQNGFTLPFYDNAANWGSDAQNLGYAVNNTPAVGSIYYTTSPAPDGHVAWVQNVSGSSVTIEDYNSDTTGDYSGLYTVAANSATGYIHFKDLSGSSAHGKADLIVHNPSANAYALATSTGAAFSSQGNSLSGWDAGDWVGVGDFNGDGKKDIVVHEPGTNTFKVALANSTGTGFTDDGVWYTGWSVGDWAAVGDFDKNGKADIVVHNPSTNSFNVLLNKGTYFQSYGTWYSGWSVGDWATVADVNGDGWSDIIVHDGTNAKFNVLLNSTNAPSFTSAGTWYTGSSVGNWAGSGDFDNNGKADIVVHDSSNNFTVYLNKGTYFQSYGVWYSGWSTGDWAGVGDVNGDGWSDIVVHDGTNAKFNVLLNSTSTTAFNPSGTWLSGWSAGDWTGMGDVNGS